MNIKKSPISIAISALLMSGNVLATTTESLEVITVTSDFRQTSLQSTPISATVLTQQEMSAVSAQNLEEIAAFAANLNFSQGAQRARYYQIRGIGERSQFQEPINPSVGIIIDDVDFTGIGGASALFDVAQVDILRGPQGTQFGANAMAGLINIKTPDASEQFEGKLRLTAGNYDSYGAGLMLSGPLSEGLNYRAALEQYQSDGFIENKHLGRDDTNDRDELSGRFKLQWQVNNETRLDVGAFVFDFDNGYDAFSLDNNRNTLSDNPGFDKQDTKALTAKVHSSAYYYADLDLIISHADSELAYGYDEDWSHEGLHPWEYASTDHYFRDKKVSTAEYRLTSKDSSVIFGNTQWVVGAYAKFEEEDLNRVYTYLESDFNSTFDAETLAGYVQLDSQLTQALVLTTGLRLERRDFDYKNSDGYQADPDENMVGGKVTLAYTLNDADLIYGSINRGYKAGGVNTDGTLPEQLREFDSETVWNVELGYKATFEQGFIRSAVFYMDRDDMQVKSSQELKREDGSSEFLLYLGNAASGKNYGVEIESAWQVNTLFSVNASVGYLDTELDDYVNQDGVDLSGREQAHAPKYTAYVGINLDLNDALTAKLGIQAKDEYFFSDSHNEKSDSEVLINASVTYQVDQWAITAWGRNLTDEDYKTRGFYFGNDPRDGYSAKQYYQLGEPAVFGVTANYRF